MSKDILKSSETLREALRKRWKDLEMSQADVVRDAVERKVKMTVEAISKYVNRPSALGSLNQEQICWLAWRYDVPIFLKVGEPQPKAKEPLVGKYDEKRALSRLAKIFPPSHEIYTKGK